MTSLGGRREGLLITDGLGTMAQLAVTNLLCTVRMENTRATSEGPPVLSMAHPFTTLSISHTMQKQAMQTFRTAQ